MNAYRVGLVCLCASFLHVSYQTTPCLWIKFRIAFTLALGRAVFLSVSVATF